MYLIFSAGRSEAIKPSLKYFIAIKGFSKNVINIVEILSVQALILTHVLALERFR